MFTNKILKMLYLFSFMLMSCKTYSNVEVYYYKTLPHNPEVEKTHVFLIGLDGWGSYSFENENFSMPTIKELMNNGSYTLQALNVMPSISLPNWSSMFMGASPNITGYWTNKPSKAVSKIVDSYRLFPSIFTLLKKQRPQCKVAFFYEWRENGALCPNNVIDTKRHINNLSKKISIVTNYIKTEKPNFCTIIIDEPDHIGHSIGHNTQAYYEELNRLDGLIAQIIQSIKDAGIWDNSIIIFSSDHGGVGKGHGGDTHLEREIPFIIFGNNIKKGTKISQNVMIYDIAPTIANIFELETPLFWEGRVIDVAKLAESAKIQYTKAKEINHAASTNYDS
jgi:predicted AlkP superfamily pyrophosphatase or phosphodiesterase